ncbi:hypothetical protein VOLCADRAFT_82450 [Volvox carteri f. nagariensis]|uniref:SCP domain-containing protein n=1 Tax=Volvox carteri f. nagariensis TaxID=3068 RepID=D8U4Z6_VOLCA|nr:uncharacterized protein VOLCADRAFT_82450 [Volvox carteri f. nagariensis]EFJ45357.1 hypothetical protein VOLCADRAFT_82450 [Volvox carteri f. nagariensis]|eukprot:XP_002953733.1 hypothetical protein VOLCADRAFT_82450 [Volvox carteri f. nagariensis]
MNGNVTYGVSRTRTDHLCCPREPHGGNTCLLSFLPRTSPTVVVCCNVGVATAAADAGCADPAAALLLHNQYRARHGSPALGWDNTLAQQAKNWAANLALNNSCGLHNEGVTGENLYTTSTSSQTSPLNCSRAVEAWYGEISLYKFTSTPYTDNPYSIIARFTQVVWASTAQVGCAAARGMNCYVVVCYYAPPGNIIGDSYLLANVFPPVSARRSLEVDIASVEDVLPTGSDRDGRVVITSVA